MLRAGAAAFAVLIAASSTGSAGESCAAPSLASGKMSQFAAPLAIPDAPDANTNQFGAGMPGVSATGPTPNFSSLTEIHDYMKKTNDELLAIPRASRRLFMLALSPTMKKAIPMPASVLDLEFLHAIQFTDKSVGWALDYNGMLEATSDGGLHWRARRLATLGEVAPLLDPRAGVFRKMHFADKTFGAIVGLGPIQWTQDGGLTWKPAAPLAAYRQINTVFCQAPKTCWLAGDELGSIFKTEDAFKSWTREETPATGLITAIQFVGSDGWAVTLKGEILGSRDGGASWTRLYQDAAKSFRALTFIDARQGWVVGGRGLIMRTEDGGKSWATQDFPVPAGFPIDELRWEAVKFANNRQGWTAGLNGFIAGTSDGGGCWTLQRSEGFTNSLTIYSLEVTDGPVVWAAGNLGNIFVSTDGGAFWFPVHGPAVDVMHIVRRALDVKASMSSLCERRIEINAKVRTALSDYAAMLEKSGQHARAVEVARQLRVLSAPVQSKQGAHPLGFSTAAVLNNYADDLKRAQESIKSEQIAGLAKMDADSNFACYFTQQLNGGN